MVLSVNILPQSIIFTTRHDQTMAWSEIALKVNLEKPGRAYKVQECSTDYAYFLQASFSACYRFQTQF